MTPLEKTDRRNTLNAILKDVPACPLCGGRERHAHSHAEPNLYSEKLAELTGVAESLLVEGMPNMQCRGCGLVYKRRWIETRVLRRLFREQVPAHPKGWDAVSDRFRPDGFLAELDVYRNALRDGDRAGIARWRRALTSIIESIPELADRPERGDLLAAVAEGDCVRASGHAVLLREVMNEPAPFSRFAGFCSEAIWDWCERHAGPIEGYAELGCPLWGLLPVARARGARAAFLSRREPNYWSHACRQRDRTCVAHLESEIGIPARDWRAVEAQTYTVIGAFQYLDHLEAPVEFMQALFDKARSCLLILDRL